MEVSVNNKNSSAKKSVPITQKEGPGSDSLTQVLIQGLQSKDKQMLETVFTNCDEKIIRNTLKKVPIDYISLLLTQLQSSLFSRSDNPFIYIKWLEQLLSLRLPFLMTLPNIEEEFAPIIELLNARTTILDRIYRLKGRLNLMISQIQTINKVTSIVSQKPQIDYESSTDSSSEDFMDDQMNDMFDNNSEESDMISEEDKEEDKEEEEHQSSDESLDEDNLMSDDEDYDDSEKVNGIDGSVDGSDAIETD